MATGQAIFIVASSGFTLSLRSWPKSWIMGAFETVIVQVLQTTGFIIITRNKAGLNVAAKA